MEKQILKIALIVFLLALLFTCRQQGNDWQGTIEEVGGVTVVKNPIKPLYGEDVLELSEELTIGVAEGKEEYMFQMVRDIDADAQGNIYVVEGRLSHVCVFDENGKYIRTIGSKGQGPGELQMPIYVQVTDNDEIAVHDYSGQRLSHFSIDGAFLRQVSTSSTRSPFIPIRIDPQGHIATIAAFGPPPVGGKQLRYFNANLELISTITKEERDMRKTFDIGKPTWFCDVSPSGRIFWGDSKEYVINILNRDCTLIRRITKKHKPHAITAEDRDSYRERYASALERGLKIEFRSHYPAFGEINVDEEERIFVRTFKKVEGRDNRYYHDVFDAEGKYITTVPIRSNLSREAVWKNNKLYTIEMNEEGYQQVKRYRVTWNL